MAADHLSTWRVAPRSKLRLAAIDPEKTPRAPGDKEVTKAATAALRTELVELQARLYAEGEQALLVVLQAMDTGGKDGTIRNVLAGVNPQGVTVTPFGPPTEIERAHDFLWRVHPHVPPAGQIAVFNRSHYEDVLVARVHGLVEEATWRRRFEHIRAFEALLADADTTVVKVMLHISRDEQAERLQSRLDDPAKHWKFDAGDLAEREKWDLYERAFEDAIIATTTPGAPWFVVGANRKWYRDWVVTSILVDALRRMDPQYPAAPDGMEDVEVS